MKALLDAGLLHGDCLTVTGKTMAENLADIAPPDPTARSCARSTTRSTRTGGIAILRGSLAPEGAVVKIAGFDARRVRGHRAGLRRRGRRDGRRRGRHARSRRRRGDPLRGPEGRPGHARDARGHRRHQGRRPRQGRAARSPTAASPAARPGCASATSRPRRSTAGRSRSSATATAIRLDVAARRSTCWSTRRAAPRAAPAGRPPGRRTTRGVLAKYAKLVARRGTAPSATDRRGAGSPSRALRPPVTTERGGRRGACRRLAPPVGDHRGGWSPRAWVAEGRCRGSTTEGGHERAVSRLTPPVGDRASRRDHWTCPAGGLDGPDHRGASQMPRRARPVLDTERPRRERSP